MALPQYKMIQMFKQRIGELYGFHDVSIGQYSKTTIYNFSDSDLESIKALGQEFFGNLLHSIKVVRFDCVCDRISFLIGKSVSPNHATFEFNPKEKGY